MADDDLCRAFEGKEEDGNCVFDKDKSVFNHCTSLGGKVDGEERCIVPKEKLKELT